MKKIFLLLLACLLLFAACKSGIEPQGLYGKWNYIRVEKPASPSDSLKSYEIDEQKPYIVFNKDHTLQIFWGGKLLSHGKFSTAGQDIKYREELGDGKVRDFPFSVNKLTDKQIIFETLGEDGSRVTAVRE
ncbi:hypothetical protein A0256_02645 [Mucilaginibacter sp. PAMC 26640]|nr:hypothetical protein A0256_02645 [Mucilaginibacter sp. PAMC 26640]